MANSDRYLGFYVGLDAAGNLKRVAQYVRNGSISLSMVRDDGTPHTHIVAKGRDPEDEVRIVYRLTNVQFVTAGMEESEYAKQIMSALKEQSASKRDQQ